MFGHKQLLIFFNVTIRHTHTHTQNYFEWKNVSWRLQDESVNIDFTHRRDEIKQRRQKIKNRMKTPTYHPIHTFKVVQFIFSKKREK